MTEKHDIWTPRLVEIFTEYAKGNDDTAKGMLSNNTDAVILLEAIMTDKLSNALLRERITLNIAGLTHSYTMHHYDGYDNDRARYAEVKSEQHCSINGRNYQVTGGGAFGIQGYESIYRFTSDNPIMLMSAFIDGRLAYVVAFDFTDSTIAIRLEDTIDRRKNDDAKTQPKFLWSDWIDSKSLTVVYYNQQHFSRLYPYASADLMLKLKRKWTAQQSVLKINLLAELTSQTQSNISSLVPDSDPLTKIDPSLQTPSLCTAALDPQQSPSLAETQPICPSVIS